MFKFNTRTLVATAIGAALFTVLFMYVKFPSPVANTDFHTSYGLGAFFGVLFVLLESPERGLLGYRTHLEDAACPELSALDF